MLWHLNLNAKSVSIWRNELCATVELLQKRAKL